MIGNALKFAVGLYLVSKGYGWLGAVVGYMCPSLITSIISFTYALKKVSLKPMVSIKALLDIVDAGIAYWIPGVLNTVGMHLGVLVVFGTSGAVETGLYYVASAVANLVLMLSISMLTLLLPALSGLESGREESAKRVLRVSSSIMFPLATYLTFYPWLPLSLLGRTYVEASPMLSARLLGALPIVVMSCITNFIYACGMYRYVLLIGLITNVFRVALYTTLVPLYRGLGAALAFTIGSFLGFAAALTIACRVGFRMELFTIMVAYIIPFASAGILCAIHTPWYVTAIIILLVCTITYPRLGIIRRSDLRDVSYALIGRDKTVQLYNTFKSIVDALFKK